MSHRILVIDHHPQGLQRVVDPLREAGYEVAVAQTVADGASTFGRFEPELVFIAARLPRTHGTVLCRELKRTDAGANTPIVLIVEGTGIQIDLPPLDQFGADRLLQKPVSPDELLAVCRELLDGKPNRTATNNNEPGSDANARPDDGLSIALEELDSLDFDLPDEVVRGAGETPKKLAVELSDDSGEDIQDHLDDLLSGKKASPPAPAPAAAPAPTPAPAPLAGPEPSTGRDHDADSAVIDELELGNDLNSTLGAEEKPAATKPVTPPAPVQTRDSTATRRTEAPRAPSATTTVSEPAPDSEQTAGRFQTEAFTSRRNMPQPFPVAAEVQQVTGAARWSWIAIPLTVAVVFLAAFFMARPRESTPNDGFAATPLGSAELDGTHASDRALAGTSFGFPADPLDETDPPIGTIEPVEETSVEPAPRETQPRTSKPIPPEHEPEPVKPAPIRITRKPVAEREPAPRAEPPANDPEPRNMVREPEPEPESEPETTAPVVTAPEIVVQEPATVGPAVEDDAGFEPDPAPPVEITMPDQDPEPQIVVPEPITRDPILIQRAEPNFSAKDLKKGGGTVVLRIRISATGGVTRVLVEQGLPGSALEAAAVAAVLRWRYEPALDRDEPVEAWTTARFTFE